MTGVLNVDTIADNAGTGPVTLTKQSAAKATFAMSLRTGTDMGISPDSLSDMCLNISSGTDAGTGLARGNLTSAMDSQQYILTCGTIAANNTTDIDVGVSTSSLVALQGHDADSSTDANLIHYFNLDGDLA